MLKENLIEIRNKITEILSEAIPKRSSGGLTWWSYKDLTQSGWYAVLAVQTTPGRKRHGISGNGSGSEGNILRQYLSKGIINPPFNCNYADRSHRGLMYLCSNGDYPTPFSNSSSAQSYISSKSRSITFSPNGAFGSSVTLNPTDFLIVYISIGEKDYTNIDFVDKWLGRKKKFWEITKVKAVG